MSEESKARQHAANAQADNIVDVDRAHHVGVPRGEEIESDPKAIKRAATEPEPIREKSHDPQEQPFGGGGGSRGLEGHTGSGKGPLDHQSPNV
ncbi:hypothetical protein Q9L58_004679 [Maublancomyces gigas]|uniref:Uncharacterized protein n=1 Tax=Discina gigas TaxID=1032678 RepID=A0ABR3GK67_9PEZI